MRKHLFNYWETFFRTFCRELLSFKGLPTNLELANSPPLARVTFKAQPGREFGIALLNLMKKADWNNDFLKQVILVFIISYLNLDTCLY